MERGGRGNLLPELAQARPVCWGNNPVYETAKETLMYRTVLWTLWETERVGRLGIMLGGCAVPGGEPPLRLILI